ncbi:MAG: hypothetical protein GF405_08790 [Candidatus Eisenbacteria bacterium]|nr:hypothetical protein [Candidatus Eisenbacteria bacterium]
MIRGWLVYCGLLLSALAGGGCDNCLEQGRNGVPAPGEDEFQLVFSNIVSRESDLLVDGVEVGTVCAETEYATVGNFPVDTHSIIEIHNKMSATYCAVSPNCDSNCDSQVCEGDPVIDTTPFAGQIFSTGFIWRE